MNRQGQIDFRLTSLYRSWANSDAPPSRVKPLPPALLTQVVTLAHQEHTPTALAAAEVLTLGFFFLLRLGEYLGHPNDVTDSLFRLRDVTFWVGARALDHAQCPVADLQSATFATLTFTRQKNGVRNETIGHGRSGHPTICPVLCLVARVLALRSWQAPPLPPSMRSAPRLDALSPTPKRATSRVACATPLPSSRTPPSTPATFRLALRALVAPWRFYARGSGRTGSAWSGAGAPTNFIVTCMCKPSKL